MAVKFAKGNHANTVMCHRNESIGNDGMKRGKPHKLVTQILVGALEAQK